MTLTVGYSMFLLHVQQEERKVDGEQCKVEVDALQCND
jgi:hypothetical protein